MKETLAEFVKRIRAEKKLTTSDVQKASQDQISDAYVSQIENGSVKNVSLEKLTALAAGLGIPDIDVIRVAMGLTDDLEARFWDYASRFNAHDLSNSEWQFLETNFNDLVKQFVLAKKQRQKDIEEMIRKHEKATPSEP